MTQCGTHVDSQRSLICCCCCFLTYFAFESPTFFVFIPLCTPTVLQGFLFLAAHSSSCHPGSWAFIEPSCVNAVQVSASRNARGVGWNHFFFLLHVIEKYNSDKFEQKCLWVWVDLASDSVIDPDVFGAFIWLIIRIRNYSTSVLSQFPPWGFYSSWDWRSLRPETIQYASIILTLVVLYKYSVNNNSDDKNNNSRG